MYAHGSVSVEQVVAYGRVSLCVRTACGMNMNDSCSLSLRAARRFRANRYPAHDPHSVLCCTARVAGGAAGEDAARDSERAYENKN